MSHLLENILINDDILSFKIKQNEWCILYTAAHSVPNNSLNGTVLSFITFNQSHLSTLTKYKNIPLTTTTKHQPIPQSTSPAIKLS